MQVFPENITHNCIFFMSKWFTVPKIYSKANVRLGFNTYHGVTAWQKTTEYLKDGKLDEKRKYLFSAVSVVEYKKSDSQEWNMTL